jgi:membrane protease YdiL (CAAX protease family)
MKLGLMLVEIAMVIAAFGFGLYALRKAQAQGRPLLQALGLDWHRGAAHDLGVGIAIAATAMAAIFSIESLLGAISQRAAPDARLLPLMTAAGGMLAAAFKEEVVMRCLLLSGLLLALGGRAAPAIGISALAFGLIHLSNPGATAMSVIGNSLGGVMYGLAFVLTKRLWLPVGLHFAWNFTQGPLLGFPVSGMDAGGLQRIHDNGPAWLTGGAYGPEGGAVGIAFRFVVIALMLLWVRWSRQRQLPMVRSERFLID